MAKRNEREDHSLPRLSAQDAQFATVLVGPKKKRFIVHQDLLTYHSKFFKAALIGNFKEAGDRTVALEEEDPLMFEFFVHWLYSADIPKQGKASIEVLDEWAHRDDNGNTETSNLINLYILADRYDAVELRHLTLTNLFAHMELVNTNLPHHSHIRYAFENLSAGSNLLRFLIDTHCHYAGECFWEDFTVHEYPSSFLDGILSRYAQSMHDGRSSYEELTLCDYHEHKNPDEVMDCEWSARVLEAVD